MNAPRADLDSDEEEDHHGLFEVGLLPKQIYKETVRLEIVRIVECEARCKGPKCHLESCK